MTQESYSFRALIQPSKSDSFFTQVSVTGIFSNDEDARQAARQELEKLYPEHTIGIIDLLSIA